MPLAPALVRVLADPVDHGPLAIVGDTILYNPRLRRAYPVVDGIPVLIADRARSASGAEHGRYIDAALGWTGPSAPGAAQ
jgi:uncharacterized protein